MAEGNPPELPKKSFGRARPAVQQPPPDQRYNVLGHQTRAEQNYQIDQLGKPRNEPGDHSRSAFKAELATKNQDLTDPVERELREILDQAAEKK